MQPLEMNLSSRPFRNNTLVWAAHCAALVLVAAFTTWNVTTYTRHGQLLSDLRNQVDSFDNRIRELENRDRTIALAIDKFDLKVLSVRSEMANEVIQRRALSWTRLFNLIEKVMPYEVKMAAIRPVYTTDARRTGKGGLIPAGSTPVSVRGEAKTLEAFLEFERSLLMDEHFSQVEPERSQLDENGIVDFELRFFYFPEGQGDDAEHFDLPPMLDDSGRPITERPESEPAPPVEEARTDPEPEPEPTTEVETASPSSSTAPAVVPDPAEAVVVSPVPAAAPAAVQVAKPKPVPRNRPAVTRRKDLEPTAEERAAAADWTPFVRDESQMTEEEKAERRAKRRGGRKDP